MGKSLEERMEIAKGLMRMGFGMTKPLMAGTLKNKVFSNSCTGYTFRLDNLSYRGIWVSTLEGIELIVDGERVPEGDMLFCINGLKIPIADLGGHSEVFWGARDIATLSVNQVGGLKTGDHKFEILIRKRADFGHSYGEGEQGYEDATEFHHPAVIRDAILYTI